MAPLFKVFSDEISTNSTSTARRSTLGLKASSHNNGKENINPRSALSSASTKGKGKETKVNNNNNGICTGELRTRILPDLPPLAPPSRIFLKPSSSAAKATITRRKKNDGELLIISDEGDGDESRDSGYAKSYSSQEVDVGLAAVGQGHADGSVKEMLNDNIAGKGMSRGAEERPSQDIAVSRETDGDRAARGLTESPLAEVRSSSTGWLDILADVDCSRQITQAFTSLSTDSYHLASPTHHRSSASRLKCRSDSPDRGIKSISMQRVISKPYTFSATTPILPTNDSLPTGTIRKSKAPIRVLRI
jgi:hypothetical protein